MSPNSTNALVIAPSSNKAVFNSTHPFSCRVPSFFVALSSWTSQAQESLLIGGLSRQYDHVGQYAQLQITPTCVPGSFVNISSILLSNMTALYDFLVPLASSAQLCSRCIAGTSSVSFDMMSFCPNCTAGTFANANNTKCERCPAGMWSRAGSQTNCQECSSNATTREQDHCVTLAFLHPPLPTIVSGVVNKIPAVALMDVFDSVIVQRSGIVSIQLQCQPPSCQTDINADFNLVTSSVFIVNGLSEAADVVFFESSQIKVGTGFVWRIFTSQETNSTLASSNIDSLQSLFRIMFLGGAAFIGAVSPTQVASIGGTTLTVTSAWKLTPRILNEFVNSSALCVFDFIGSAESSNTTFSTSPQGSLLSVLKQERIRAVDVSETVKMCSTPAISEFTYANLTIILQDGRMSPAPFTLISVCHKNFYINSSKCHACPVSAAGRSSHELINAESIEFCVCSMGSYGTFGKFCRFCPTPLSFRSPPFICNSSNLRYPVVAPGFWADYSLLPRCDADSSTCSAVMTCAFGARACPGGGEKNCAQNVEECYEGIGCSNCCPLYYNENNACFKCPDSSESIALLAVVAVVCFILAVLMSSVSSPSFTQSSKHLC